MARWTEAQAGRSGGLQAGAAPRLRGANLEDWIAARRQLQQAAPPKAVPPEGWTAAGSEAAPAALPLPVAEEPEGR